MKSPKKILWTIIAVGTVLLSTLLYFSYQKYKAVEVLSESGFMIEKEPFIDFLGDSYFYRVLGISSISPASYISGLGGGSVKIQTPKTTVEVQALEGLRYLGKIRYLDLSNTTLADEHIAYLEVLNAKEIYLYNTNVSEQGLNRLRTNLKKSCEVFVNERDTSGLPDFIR